MGIKLKRIYEEPAVSDGIRILVERLWPRGLSKEKAKIDLWLKEVAPSTELRKWFNHDPEKWGEFKKRYYLELQDSKQALKDTLDQHEETVTFVYASREETYNNAVALKEYVEELFK